MNIDDQSTREKFALIVGGASGIGEALANQYAKDKVTTVVWDIAGQRDIDCDITDPAAIRRATAETANRFGIPNEISITAGIGRSGRLADELPETWDHVLAVNTRGPWLVMRELAQHLEQQQLPGSIVATSSISAHIVDRGMGLYCASKAALNMLVQVAAAEWATLGIRVNAVAPGVTQTPMLGRAPTDRGWLRNVQDRTALGRLGRPEDIAATIRMLHGQQWVTGQILDCDGGLSLHSPINAFDDTHSLPSNG